MLKSDLEAQIAELQTDIRRLTKIIERMQAGQPPVQPIVLPRTDQTQPYVNPWPNVPFYNVCAT